MEAGKDRIIPLAADGTFDADVPCKRCGYNLRGLPETGFCPECGTPVGKSMGGDLLRFADPDWIGRVSRGMNVIVIAIIVGIVMGCLGGIGGAIAGAPGIAQALGLLTSVLSVYGVWLLTEPDPSGVGEDRQMNARRIVRFLVAIGLAFEIAELMSEALPSGILVSLAVPIITIASAIAFPVAEFFKFKFYEVLALRIPDQRLARRARFLRWALLISMLVLLVGSVGTALTVFGAATVTGAMPGTGPNSPTATAVSATNPATSAPASGPVVTYTSFSGTATSPFAAGGLCLVGPLIAAAGVAALIFWLMTIFLLLRMRKALAEQAALARNVWSDRTV